MSIGLAIYVDGTPGVGSDAGGKRSLISTIVLAVNSLTRHKISIEIDTAKIDAVKELLGTKTLTDTVDAALSEVIKVRQRRDLVEILFRPGALDLDNSEVMSRAWR